jgi:hypothetical protein
VSKAILWWEQLFGELQSLPFNLKMVKQISVSTLNKLPQVITSLLILLLIPIMGWWNWKLFIATISGIGIMLFIYWLQIKNWQRYWFQWQHFLTEAQRKLSVAVICGGVTAFTTYLAASIWADSNNRWLATGSILQGCATIITLILLAWHIKRHRTYRQEAKWEYLLADLTHINPLKRLIAVRQLTLLLSRNGLPFNYRSQLKEYFCLMLSQPQELPIREALLDSLQNLNIHDSIPDKKEHLRIPINLQYSPQRLFIKKR